MAFTADPAMLHDLGPVWLRKPEPEDLPALYAQKNHPDTRAALGGFTTGYAMADLRQWMEAHRTRADEVLWVVAEADTNRCLGHVGLYRIDSRIRSAEFAILLGDPQAQGRGLGKRCTRFMLDYGFLELNLHRIELTVLATNARAIALYERLGFRHEGRLRDAQFRDGAYVDVLAMALLASDLPASDDAPDGRP